MSAAPATEPAQSHLGQRTRRWGTSVFRLAPDEPRRRRASDVVRVLLAVLAVTVAAVLARNTAAIEQNVYQLLAELPATLEAVFDALYVLGSWGVIAVIAVLALIFRRVRLAAELTTAAVASWLGALVLSWAADADATREALFGADSSPGFPVVRVAAAVAIVSTASPYLARPMRRFAHLFVAMGAVGAIAGEQGLPLDVLAAFALGWGTAAAVHLVFGSAAGTPTPGDVAESLESLGVTATDIAMDEHQSWGSTRFTARSPAGDRLAVAVYGRDAADAQLAARVWRFIWYRDSGVRLSVTRQQQVEHEAYVTLLARRDGAAVPDVVTAGLAGSDDAVIVTLVPTGASLDTLDPSAVGDDLLASVWHQLSILHGAGIAHGAFNSANVVVHDGRVVLRGLERATSSASPEHRQLDVVELLVSTAIIVGVDRALAAALAAVGPGVVAGVLPVLQPTALSRPTRKAVHAQKAILGELRTRGAELAGTEEPQLEELRRVSPATIAMIAGAAIGVFILLSQLSGVDDIWATLQTADLAWVLAALLVSQLTNVTGAIAVAGSVRMPLPFGPLVGLQLALNFTGLIGGTVANTALIIRFFQKRGLAASVAVSSGVLASLVGMMAQVVLVVICLILIGPELDLPSTTGSGGDGVPQWVLPAILAVGLVVGLVVLVPRVRRRIVGKLKPQLDAMRENLRGVASEPGKVGRLLGGQAGTQLVFAITLGCSLEAYGDSLSLPALVLVNSFASLIGGLAPVPGGMGVMEAGLVAGLTAAGVPTNIAVAAAITHRLITAYLPPIWGWFSLNWMRRHDYL